MRCYIDIKYVKNFFENKRAVNYMKIQTFILFITFLLNVILLEIDFYA